MLIENDLIISAIAKAMKDCDATNKEQEQMERAIVGLLEFDDFAHNAKRVENFYRGIESLSNEYLEISQTNDKARLKRFTAKLRKTCGNHFAKEWGLMLRTDMKINRMCKKINRSDL